MVWKPLTAVLSVVQIKLYFTRRRMSTDVLTTLSLPSSFCLLLLTLSCHVLRR